MPVANEGVGDKLLSGVFAVEQVLLVVSAWLATRPYGGIRHDAFIYIGRALADIDPKGVGRDALFTFDGQTRLSAYNYLSVPLVHYLGPSVAAAVLTCITLAIWLAAATWLASRLMPRRLLAAALICAATLPAVYGPFGVFSFAEAFAVPRGLAEAIVLASIAALLSGRRIASCCLLLLALAFHTPTALVGIGIVFIMLAREWPLLWLSFAGLCAGIISAACLHIGPFSTLLQHYDPVWLAINRERNPFLFESMWPAAAWSHAIVSAATLAVAASLARGSVRTILVAALAVAAAGVLTAYVFGELPSDILILQLQTWRTLWLVKLLAIVMIPFCAVSLWPQQRTASRLVVFFLACAWYSADYPQLAIPLSLLALVLRAYGRSAFVGVRPALAWAVFAGLAVALFWMSSEIFVSPTAAAHAAHVPLRIDSFSALVPTLALLAAGLAVALSVAPWTASATAKAIVLTGLVAIIFPLALLSFDQREPIGRLIDTGAGRDTLASALGPTPKGVVWVGDSIAPIFWAGRSTWVNGMQGTAGAFSRPLAIQWDARSELLLTNGLMTQQERDPVRSSDNELDPARIARGIVTVCKNRDGPDAIVVPYNLTKYFPDGRAKIWLSPRQDAQRSEIGKPDLSLGPRYRYSILHCADFRSPA
jgi:hypothetical protein